MNRIDRLMAMVMFLQGRRVTRAEDMAEHFEISLRTVYRDLSALSEAGIPLVAEAGVGYSLMRGYHLPPVMFTGDEAVALAMAGVLTEQMTDHSLHGAMQSALLKIRAVLPADQQQRLQRVEEGTRIRMGEPDRSSAASLIEIQGALSDRCVLSVKYRSGSRDEITTREVEPLGLVRYLDFWHLIAWCRLRQDIRDFRVDRVLEMKRVNTHFEPRPDFDLQRFIDDMRDVSVTTSAKVRFHRHVAERARREWSLGLVDEEREEDGVTFTFTTSKLEWMADWLLSFGSRATVVEPKELKTMVHAAAIEAAEHHSP